MGVSSIRNQREARKELPCQIRRSMVKVNYTKEQIKNLVETLTELKYEEIADFFEDAIKSGYLEFGLKVPGSTGSAIVCEKLKQLFPDVLYALMVDEKELSVYVDKKVGQEYPIALWRLS